MIYLIYVTWENTKDNHAGMKNLCNHLVKLFPDKFMAIEAPAPQIKIPKNRVSLLGRLFNKSVYFVSKIKVSCLTRFNNRRIVNQLKLSEKDTVILMEYMFPIIYQLGIAKLIKKKYSKNKIYGLAHLIPSMIDQLFNIESLRKWLNPIDYLMTLGSSLSEYYIRKGVAKSKILTTFHYVDDYYITDKIKDGDFKVLIQGKLMRDRPLLEKIIEQNHDIDFVICQGLDDMKHMIERHNNVTLMPFLPEPDLKVLMSECPVSLNVMIDTVGSNVITTSLGMGQAMVCSDVGSIRDYCDETNCIFCRTVSDFSDALHFLKNNQELLLNMRKMSLKKSSSFRISEFAKKLLKSIE